jgi:serine/threonine protein kinase
MAATERATGIKVALKYIEMKPTEGVPPTTLRETSILKKLRHPNVVTLYEVMNMGNKLVLVFERLDFDLKTFLDKHRRFEPCNHFIIMSSSNTKHDFKKKGCPICAQPVANVSNNLEESTVMVWDVLALSLSRSLAH